jgi:hypothetical protein
MSQFDTIYLGAVIGAFTLFAVVLFAVTLWSKGGPARPALRSDREAA